ncbi:MAG TPA: hypothetical protein VH061_09645 [Solirubrobacteraceae bacterium]|jgi:hypothetical protein|nr:hypothetical protein [Solirubrobacteraceae bacterium]
MRRRTYMGEQQSPAYAADGSKLAYVNADHLYIAAPDGTDPQHLATSGIGDIDNPVFTPDANQIVFTGTEHEDAEADPLGQASKVRHLYRINTDGTGLTALDTTRSGDVLDHGAPALGPTGTVVVPARPTMYLRAGFGGSFSVSPYATDTVNTDGSGVTSLPEVSTPVVAFGLLGRNARVVPIPGGAPDGWCNGHLHGIAEQANSPVYRSYVYETSGEVHAGYRSYGAGVDIERDYDCEGGTSHIYWVPWYDTSHLESTPILMSPTGERYDGTKGDGAIREFKPKQVGPYHGVPQSSESTLLRYSYKFRVRAAKTTASDPRMCDLSLVSLPTTAATPTPC